MAGMDSRGVVVAVLLYCLSALSDSLISVYMVSRLGFVELNPHMAPILGTSTHFVMETLAFLTLISLMYVMRRALLLAARKSDQEAIRRVAERTWIMLLPPAVLRWIAVIHNLILLLTGWESPLSLIYRLTSSA